MKLTKKKVKTEVETSEVICEISQDEFDNLCAEKAAKIVTKFIGDDVSTSSITAGLHLTKLLAEFVCMLGTAMFTEPKTTKNTDKKENK